MGLAVSTGPHIPMTTSAGHFLSMQPAQGIEPRSAVWYRGTDWDIVAAERERFKRALQEVVAVFDKEDMEVLDFLEIAERALK